MTTTDLLSRTLLLAALATAPAAAGCAPRAAPATGLPAAPDERARESAPTRSSLTVYVENQGWTDVVVYLQSNALRTRLGSVTSQTTASFAVPAAVAVGGARIFLEADPIGSRSLYRSEAVLVEPGDVIEWTISARLPLSHLRVR